MNTRRKLRAAAEYGAARLLTGALRILPRRLAVWIGGALAYSAYLLIPKLRYVGDLNLRVAFPEMSRSERRRLLRRSMLNLGRHMAHYGGSTPAGLREIIECVGFEHLDKACSAGRGAIMITGHLGGWEITSFALSDRGYTGEFLVRRSNNPALDRLMDDIRTRFGARTVDKRSAARSMVRSLHAGRLIGLLVDINVVRDQGIFVDFFGMPASTTFITAKLSLRTGAPIVPIFALWDEQRQRYEVRVCAPVTVEQSGNETEDVRRLTQQLTKVIEDEIRRHPDQWLWIHKRWRTQPKGQKHIYS